MQKLFVTFVLAGAGNFAGLQSVSAKTVPYQATDAATLKSDCPRTGGKYGEYTDKAGHHYYWCTGSVNGTIKCLDNVCTQTTADKKRVPPTNVATGNNSQKVGNKPKPPLATTNAAAVTAAGKSAGANAVAGPGATSRTTNAGNVSAAQKASPVGGGAFAGSSAPTLRGPAGTADRRLP